ncbi:hypothetical protein CRE_16634 [Caenorhabditis remanei]|uniref:Uncharacterized protein n=1 Tax=Caenorhabditis remanei TaxID=31234 RepID=E3MAU9_CAERE|nr:hypothetical protein CRE_16634 [Caenorhabditis remanei]
MTTIAKFAIFFIVLFFVEAFNIKKPKDEVGSRFPQNKPLFMMKKSMLVGMSETTEQVCETVIMHNLQPVFGHLINGSQVEILQRSDFKFTKTYVECSRDDRPTCHGVKENMYISECVTVFEKARTMVRLVDSFGPFAMGTIKTPILCECRLRRQYREFERSDADEDE